MVKIKFNLVLVLQDESTESNRFDLAKDTMYLCGSSKHLGSWDVRKGIEMKLKANENQSFIDRMSNLSVSSLSLASSTSSEFLVESLINSATHSPNPSNGSILEFETSVEIEDLSDLLDPEAQNYKYFIAQKTTIAKDKIFLKQVEYTWRKLASLEAKNGLIEISDKWPWTDAENKQNRVDYGWLLNGENEFQFHFSNNPVQMWLTTNEQKYLSIEILPWRADNGLYELKDYVLNHVDFDGTQILNNKKTKFNALNYKDYFSSIRLRTYENPTDLLFQINLRELDDENKVSDKILATSYYKINKSLLENSLIEVDMSLLSSNQIIGSLKTEILLITSYQNDDHYLITKNYNYHFNRSCIPIGHRGMGKTFDADSLPGTAFVENTIESFREAYNRGAQMVEFDIVLTKDKIPIVYHDFIFCLDQIADKASNNYLSIAVNQLTYEEVKQSRIYSHKILKNATKIFSPEAREFFTSKLMFPTLKEMAQQLDPKLGFNVEIKYPIDLEDGSHEIDSHIKWLNRNDYVDVIVKELYQWCSDGKRCVIITTFDPNLCSMIRLKQNKFPVLFLTNGVTNKWKPYRDARCKNTSRSFNYAKSENLHGIVAHAEELTSNMHLVKIMFNNTAKSTNFLAYSWGDELNEVEKRKLLSESGLNGVIYDRINESTNESDN